MKTRFHRIVTAATISLTVGTAVLATAGLASAAPVPCSTRVLSTPFTGVGDPNQYFVIDGGTFEGATTSWVYGSRAATSTNFQNPAKINGASHSKGLAILPTGAPKTGDVCLYTNEASFRFFYKGTGVAGSKLTININSSNGKLLAVGSTTVDGTSNDWALSPIIPIPLISTAVTNQTVTITFTASGGTFGIDDVMVDPVKGK